MTTRVEFAAELEELASRVIALPGVSRRNPHAFAEAKDELARLMQRRALELKAPSATRAAVATIATGVRIVNHRCVPVERRSRRSS